MVEVPAEHPVLKSLAIPAYFFYHVRSVFVIVLEGSVFWAQEVVIMASRRTATVVFKMDRKGIRSSGG